MLFDIIHTSNSVAEIIIKVTLLVMVLSITFSIHEFMHAWVAERMGDDTPRHQGRITLNPIAHIDPFGAIMMLIAGFGWAKPVQYNPNNLTKHKRWVCERYISLAGVFANYMMASLASFLLVLASYIVLQNPASSEKGRFFQTLIIAFFFYLREYNFLFLAFNLLPVPPLDGYRFVSTFIPFKWRKTFDTYSQYSYYIFFALLLLGRFGNVNILSTIVNWIAFPFRAPIDLLITQLGFKLILGV